MHFHTLPNPENYGFKILQIIIGVLITGLGSGFYLISNLGPGPRDGSNDWCSKNNRKTNSSS